jgi:voltage-gated potassium channel
MSRAKRVPMRVWVAAAVPFVLLTLGTLGYKSLGEPDQWSWFDALYMSAITLTTVGYGETHPLNPPARAFTIIYLLGGVFLLFFSATEMIRAVISGQLRETLGREGVKKALADIQDHIIVVGLGRMGRLVCQEFERHKSPFVLIERDQKLLDEAQYEHGLPVHGDATEDAVLLKAGVDRARTLVTVLPEDADNLYVTLSARVLNPKLFIVARAEHETTDEKLRRVGANQVVSPYVIGGIRMAHAVLRPTVGRFLDQAVASGPDAYRIEEVTVGPTSKLCGKGLKESNLGELRVVVLTMQRPNGEIVFNPRGSDTIEAGSILVVVGQRDHLAEFETLASGAA